MATPVSNYDNIIDSRNVIALIVELEDDIESWESDITELEGDNASSVRDDIDEARETLNPLKVLAEEAEVYSCDWNHGAGLINDNHFTDFAREEAESLNSMDVSAWPFNAINWDKAARELQVGYAEVNFGGELFWIRRT